MQTIRTLGYTLTLLAAAAAHAQGADPNANYPQYPQPAAYPPASGMVAAPTARQSMRSQFAASLLQAAQVTGSGAMVAVADGLTGALRDWFDRRRMKQAMTAQGYAQPQSYPQTQGYPQPQQTMSYPQPNAPQPGYGASPAPTGQYSGQYSGADGSVGGPQVSQPYPPAPGSDANSGYGPDTGSSYGAGSGAPTNKSQMYAGIAYEIHLLNADGSTQAVDTATYSFRTGDRFRVFYRPALPGRVVVFNVNAAGQSAQIDNVDVAAGELASLGPYEFTNLTGEETLILRLSTCVTPSLLATTRDIVKSVDGAGNSSSVPYGAAQGAPQIASCSAVTTRGIKNRPKTRDIKKVSTEGGTSFALDAISPAEMQSGDYAPRQVTITLHHM